MNLNIGDTVYCDIFSGIGIISDMFVDYAGKIVYRVYWENHGKIEYHSLDTLAK
jgi:adenine-specific DNA methylase